MSRKKDTITLSVPPGTKEKLEAIARRFGIMWGKNPSPSGLIAAIARGELEVGKPYVLNSNQVRALQQAIKDLVDAGHVEEAQTVMSLLLERGNLETPLRQSLLQQVGQPAEAWRVRVNQLIDDRQPFYLTYRNSQDELLNFTVRFAKVVLYEKRMYLQTWCEETEDSRDIPELRHNRCFRLDRRIQSIIPMDGDWRGRLDEVEVQLHFRGWLVKAYEPKPEDIRNEVVDNVRQVVRRVSNPFWLLRDISRYWEDCEIVAPDSLRQQVREKSKLTHQQYD
jgi:predicted DNA-binding transcriptional regulator YafY